MREKKSGESKDNCDKRAKQYDDWCKTTGITTHFNPTPPASTTPPPLTAAKGVETTFWGQKPVAKPVAKHHVGNTWAPQRWF